MAENADVIYTIRADSSHLETDLNQAENLVRKSTERTEQALDGVAESAESSGERAAEAVENVAQSAQQTAESLNDVAEAAADTADNIGNAAQQAEQSFGDISEAAEQSGESAAGAAENVGSSAEITAEALDSIAEAAQRAGESAAGAGEELGRSTEEAGKSSEETRKKYMTLGEELDAVNKLLEKDSKNSTLCAQKKELLKKAIAETGEKLRELKSRQTDVNQAYRNGDIPDEEYREFQREVAATEQELRNYREELNNVGKASEETGEKTESKLSGAFGKVGAAVGAATAAVAAGAAAIGTAAVNSADSLDKAVKRVTTATGEGAAAAEKYSEVISNVYGDNFGENFEDIAATISTITQNLGEMDAEPLEKVTESAYALQDAFDMDVAETSRAAKAMVENFGIAAEDAFDYIAKGAQDGLDYSGELVDNISEYSVQFKKLGLSADDMFTIFANGAENGAWNLDKIGDAVKEFSIRAIDGSDTTKKGFEALGYDAEDMAKKFSQGGDVARDAFQTVIKALSEMEDPIAQNEAGVNLFGTMWEDLGADAVKALGDISDSAYDCAGAVDEIVEVNYSSLSDALGGLQRQVELLIQPLGDTLIPVVKEVVDRLSGMADEVIPELVTAIQPVIEKLVPLIEPLMELITSVLPQIVELVTPIISMISELVQTVLPPLTEFLEGELLPVIMDMFKWLEEKLFPVVQEIIAKLLPPLLDIVSSLLPLIEVALDLLEPVLDIVIALIDPLAAILEGLSPIVSILADLVRTILEPIRQALGRISDGLNDSSSILTEVFGRALEIVSELLGDTLLPALEGVAQFLSGDFIGAAETWGEGFENTVRNVCSHIDDIFGTHLAEWYDNFNNFFMEVGSRLYETWNSDKIEMEELDRKYSGMQNDLYAAVKEAIYGGAGVEEAVKRAKAKVLDSAEKVYFYEQMQTSGEWNLEDIAQRYYAGKDLPDTQNPITGSAWYADYYRSGANLPTEKQVAGQNKAAASGGVQGSSGSAGSGGYTYKPYTPTADTSKTSASPAGTSSGSKGNFISITSYVPTIWDNDQTAALKSLIGKDVLGKTTSAHQINALTGAISGAAESTSASKETDLADVINAITKLQRKVEKFENAFGDITIEMTAGDLTIGKACVRDCNIMAKRSGKSPFNF